MFGDVSGIFWGMFGVDLGGILEDLLEVLGEKSGKTRGEKRIKNIF